MEPVSKKEKKLEVVPIDNGMSEWRTLWVGDTVQADGVQYLQEHDGGKDAVLLLVYPTVGNEFTSKMINAYREFAFMALDGCTDANHLSQTERQSFQLARRIRPALQLLRRRASRTGWHAKCLIGRECFKFHCRASRVRMRRCSCLRRPLKTARALQPCNTKSTMQSSECQPLGNGACNPSQSATFKYSHHSLLLSITSAMFFIFPISA